MIEKKVSKGIISTYFAKMERCLELDVAIVWWWSFWNCCRLLYGKSRTKKWRSSTASYRLVVVCGEVL